MKKPHVQPKGPANIGKSTLPPSPDLLRLRTIQISHTLHLLPLLLLFHAAASIAVNFVASGHVAGVALNSWLIISAGVGVNLLAVMAPWWRGVVQQHPLGTVRLLGVLGTSFGLVWALAAAYVAARGPQEPAAPVIGLAFAIMGIGVFAFKRVPVAGIVLAALLTAAIAGSLYNIMSTNGQIAAIVCAVYGLVMIGMVISSHRDFLRRDAVESELLHQARDIKLLLNDFENGSSDWLWETDAAGSLIYASPHLALASGQPLASMIGRTWAGILADTRCGDNIGALALAMQNQTHFENLELHVHVRDECRHWQMSAKPLFAHDAAFTGYRGVGRDVTSSRTIENKLQLAVQAAERASSAKSMFLATMGHELRTPINAIVGFSELLTAAQGDIAGTASRREYCRTILDSARHLQLLINDILDATRIEKDALRLSEQDNDFGELVEVAVKMCREQAEKAGTSLVARLVDGINVRGDMTRIKQVVLNLLVNAIKFSPAGGIVHVDMSRAPAGQLVLSVRDAGIGISADDLGRVFEPFVQAEEGTTRRFGGAGLGLSIAKRIAELHGGDIVLESEPGAGTTANFLLPRARVSWPVAADGSRSVLNESFKTDKTRSIL